MRTVAIFKEGCSRTVRCFASGNGVAAPWQTGIEKASLFLKELHSKCADVVQKKQRFSVEKLNRAANIIKNFVNPKKDENGKKKS
jgi:hypothetical protein